MYLHSKDFDVLKVAGRDTRNSAKVVFKTLTKWKTVFWARSHTGVIDYDEACSMHFDPVVEHNFPKAVGV